MSSDTEAFLRRLFLHGEGVCITDDAKGTSVVPLEQVLATLPRSQFVSLNPLLVGVDQFPVQPWHRADVGRRADANVTERRNLLVEFDGVPLDEQVALVKKARLPYTTATFSGGKSIHFVVALTQPLSAVEYAETFKAIRAVLPQLDVACGNPSRLTRLAGGMRGGAEQTLLDLGKRVSIRQMASFLSRHARTISAAAEREASFAKPISGSGLAGLRPDTLEFLRGERAPRSSRHARLVAACFELAECGVDFATALVMAEAAADAWGITSDPTRLGEAQSVVNYAYKKVGVKG